MPLENIIGPGRYHFEKTKFVPVEFFEKMKRGVVQDRDVLVYKDGGRPGNFIPHISMVGSGFPFEVMSINSHVYRLRGGDHVTQEYLYFYLSSEAMMEWMHLHGTGAAIPSLARRDLKKLPVLVPTSDVLEKFDEFARPIISAIFTSANKVRTLRETRNLLLPQLISGELDVSELDIEIPEEAA